MIEMQKKRSDAIDMVKGLSIMTLFFLHFENGWMHPQYNYFIVRSPAFYMVVGWLWGMSSNRKTIKSHWEKRKQGLVKPYLWFSLIFLVLDVLLLAISYIPSFVLFRDIYKTLCLRGIGTLWFLPALLGGEMLFIATRDRSWWLKVGLYVVCLSVISYYAIWHNNAGYSIPHLKEIIDAPFHVLMDVCNAFIYISIAFYLSVHYGKQLFNANKILLFTIGIVACCMGFYLFNMDRLFPEGFIKFIVYNVIVGIGALLLFRSIESFKFLSTPLVYFGKNSLIVMTMHWALYQIALAVDSHVFHHTEYGGFYTVIYFFVALVLLVGIIELINRKFRFILGK